jgi:hypothetical protein
MPMMPPPMTRKSGVETLIRISLEKEDGGSF